MVDITAKSIANSETSDGLRLTTMLLRYPKFIHQEHLRHRAFSFSVSSARAIPVAKNLEEVRLNYAAPVFWGSEQKGMSAGAELSDANEFHPRDRGFYSPRHHAQSIWIEAAGAATTFARRMSEIGAHKSIVNRLLEPFLHVNVLVTGTWPGWMNFFGLRLDKAADPVIRALAEAQWKVWNESEMKTLKPGEWHTPFADDDETRDSINGSRLTTDEDLNRVLRKISAARCARLSYMSFETQKRSTLAEDLNLHDRLVKLRHASPLEHQATPDIRIPQHALDVLAFPEGGWKEAGNWAHPEEAGNLGPGWRQYRKMIAGEEIAPLPEGYR